MTIENRKQEISFIKEEYMRAIEQIKRRQTKELFDLKTTININAIKERHIKELNKFDKESIYLILLNIKINELG